MQNTTKNYWNIFEGKRSATIGEIRCSCRPMTVLDQVFVVGPPFVFSRPGMEMTKSCDFIQEIQQCIFPPPDRDAWRQDTEESLVVSSNCFFLGPASTIPPPPMVLCPLAVFPEEAGQGRQQGQDSSSWTRSSACSTR